MGTLTLSQAIIHPSSLAVHYILCMYLVGRLGGGGGRWGGGGGVEGEGGACSLVPMQAPSSQAKTNW